MATSVSELIDKDRACKTKIAHLKRSIKMEAQNIHEYEDNLRRYPPSNAKGRANLEKLIKQHKAIMERERKELTVELQREKKIESQIRAAGGRV